METLTGFRPLCGFVVLLLLTTFSREVQTCEAPWSPRCFRRNAAETVYRCEWHLNATVGHVKYNLFYECSNHNRKGKLASTHQSWYEIGEEMLLRYEKIDMWVEADIGKTTCKSSRWSAVLNDTVKYDAPENISLSWSKTNLTLRWRADENFPAEAHVRYRQITTAAGAEPWTDWKANITNEASMYKLTIVNLKNNNVHHVQLRHLSRMARNPLWSDWSPLVIVPTELKPIRGINFTKTLVNGTRSVTLTWKKASPAAAVSGVNYTANIMFASECSCKKEQLFTQDNSLVAHVFYTAVNISLRANNAVGFSPTETIHIPAESSSDLRACKSKPLNSKDRKTCLELYELQDGNQGPKAVITLTKRKTDQSNFKTSAVKNFTRYHYFEHKCDHGKPQFVEMCLFYNKEGVPVSEPYDLGSFGETHNSVNLSWKAIPLEKLRGFLTNYSLCVKKIHPEEQPEECRQIAASKTTYRLENLTPGAKYNITLAGATREGTGPKAAATVNTLPEHHQEIYLTLILILLFGVFILLPVGTWILTRLKSKILPPVPTPVILNFTTCQPKSQMTEKKVEMNELMVQQPHPEDKLDPEDLQETTGLRGDGDTDKDEDTVDRSESRLSEDPDDDSSTDPDEARARKTEESDLERVDNEIAMLIYRNGLVFDTKADFL